MKTPSQPAHLVDRPALRRRLDAVVDHSIALIVAPAGAGEDASGAAKTANSVPAAARRNIRNAGITAPSSTLACSPARVDGDDGAQSHGNNLLQHDV